MSGCYPGCFYYTDSCFRKDCKKTMNTVTYQGKVFAIVPDSDTPVAGCPECVGVTLNNGICVTYGAGAIGSTPNCMATEHHYEEVPE